MSAPEEDASKDASSGLAAFFRSSAIRAASNASRVCLVGELEAPRSSAVEGDRLAEPGLTRVGVFSALSSLGADEDPGADLDRA